MYSDNFNMNYLLFKATYQLMKYNAILNKERAIK